MGQRVSSTRAQVTVGMTVESRTGWARSHTTAHDRWTCEKPTTVCRRKRSCYSLFSATGNEEARLAGKSSEKQVDRHPVLPVRSTRKNSKILAVGLKKTVDRVVYTFLAQEHGPGGMKNHGSIGPGIEPHLLVPRGSDQVAGTFPRHRHRVGASNSPLIDRSRRRSSVKKRVWRLRVAWQLAPSDRCHSSRVEFVRAR